MAPLLSKRGDGFRFLRFFLADADDVLERCQAAESFSSSLPPIRHLRSSAQSASLRKHSHRSKLTPIWPFPRLRPLCSDIPDHCGG